mmetsp:Transcript_24642/g.77258  ORF Transcript_24642/g.77258 Transcript_24642/m.77258 type:complete len:217 (+) Transcript_24642:473-1123(+)
MTPAVSRSRRPTGTRRSSFARGTTSAMVLRPRSSSMVTSTPLGLCTTHQKMLLSSRCTTGMPSTVIFARGDAFEPGAVTTLPSTRTRPSAMSFSASRREQTPAAESSFCKRTPPSLFAPLGAAPGCALAFLALALVIDFWTWTPSSRSTTSSSSSASAILASNLAIIAVRSSPARPVARPFTSVSSPTSSMLSSSMASSKASAPSSLSSVLPTSSC